MKPIRRFVGRCRHIPPKGVVLAKVIQINAQRDGVLVCVRCYQAWKEILR